MRILKFIIFAIILIQAETSFASSEPAALTLADALLQAQENSPDLKKLQATAERVSWAKFEALSKHLPHISVNFDHFFSSNYMREGILFGGASVSFPAGYPQENITFHISMNLFDGLDSYHKYQAAQLYTESANLDFSRAQFKLTQTVRLAYYQAIAAQKLLEVAKQNVKTLEDHLSRAHLTEKAGYGTQFDVLRIEAALEEAQAGQEEAEDNVQISRDALREAMGLEKEDPRPLEGELPVLKDSDISKDLALSITDRDDLTSQMKRDEASTKMQYASRGFLFPSVTLFAEEQYYKFGTFDPAILPNNSLQNASAVGIKFTWNLFDGGYSYAKERQASQSVIEAQSETHRVLTKLPHEFATWKRRFFHAISLYQARLRVLAQNEESVRLAGIGVKTGTRTHTEMLDAELDLFRARGGLVKAQVDAVECLGNLELAVGHKLWSARD